jgi:thiol-disulfide isomerase/thioredoxin
MACRGTFAAMGGLLLACSCFNTATAQKFNHNSYIGKEPPELVSRKDQWLGWQETVILKDLKGKVVWLQFNFCENCTSLRSHLVRWEEQYAANGLFVIEINQSIGAPLHVMRHIVETKNLMHPVLWDDDCRNTKAYGIKTWPFVYLIGTDGKVFWEGTHGPSRVIRWRSGKVWKRQQDENNDLVLSVLGI